MVKISSLLIFIVVFLPEAPVYLPRNVTIVAPDRAQLYTDYVRTYELFSDKFPAFYPQVLHCFNSVYSDLFILTSFHESEATTINGSPHSLPLHVSYGFSPERHETRQLHRLYPTGSVGFSHVSKLLHNMARKDIKARRTYPFHRETETFT